MSSTSSYYTTSGSTLEDNTYSLARSHRWRLPAVLRRHAHQSAFSSTTRYSPIRRTRSRRRCASCRRPVPTTSSTTSWARSTRIRCARGMDHRRPRDAGAPGRAGMLDDYVELPGGAFYIGTAPSDVTFQQIDTQNFTDKSVFGELTWHFMPGGQLTVGGRHFSQEFTDAQSYDDYPFPTHLPATPHDSPASKTVGSRPVVRVRQGSSTSMRCGRRASAAAARTRCRWPGRSREPAVVDLSARQDRTTTRRGSRAASATASRTRSRCSTSNGTSRRSPRACRPATSPYTTRTPPNRRASSWSRAGRCSCRISSTR